MSNYSSLKATINANVKQNGNQAITGAIMNSVLNAMVDSLGAGYQYKGVATPATNPGTPDYNVFYLASEAGTYTNFGGIVIGDNEVAALVYNGSWSKQTTGAATAEEVSRLAQEIYGEETTETLVRESRQQGRVIRTTGAVETVSSQTSIVDTFRGISPNTKYLISGRVGTGANACLVCFYDAEDSFIADSYFYPSTGTATPYLNVEVIAPSNAYIMRVAGNMNQGGAYPYQPEAKQVIRANGLDDRVTDLEQRVTEIEGFNPAFDVRGLPHERIDGYYIAGSSQKWTAAVGGVTLVFRVREGERYRFIDDTTNATNYAFLSGYSSLYDGASPSFVTGYERTFSLPAGQTVDVVVPVDCYMCVNCATGSATNQLRYPVHIYKEGYNPFFGLKSVWQGPSTMYGLGTSPLSSRFSERVSRYLCMSHTNYAISGSTVAKKVGSYESAFDSLDDWNDAVSQGLVDTTKKYLVKDNGTAEFPWTIYQYTGGAWGSVQRTSANCERTPIVDRITELAPDADVVVVMSGTNDFMYDWATIGEDTDRENTTIKGAMHIICRHLVNTFPNKFIIWINGTSSFRYQGGYTTPYEKNNLNYTGWEEGEAVKEVLKQYGIPLIDMARDGGLTPENSTWWDDYDTTGTRVHPNNAGHLRLAKFLVSKMLGLKEIVM